MRVGKNVTSDKHSRDAVLDLPPLIFIRSTSASFNATGKFKAALMFPV
jgi:hypothetical protein